MGELAGRAPEEKNCPNPEVFHPAIVQWSAYVTNLFKIRQKAVKNKEILNILMLVLTDCTKCKRIAQPIRYIFKTVCPSCWTVCPICYSIGLELNFPIVQPNIFCPNQPGPTGPTFWSPVCRGRSVAVDVVCWLFALQWHFNDPLTALPWPFRSI